MFSFTATTMMASALLTLLLGLALLRPLLKTACPSFSGRHWTSKTTDNLKGRGQQNPRPFFVSLQLCKRSTTELVSRTTPRMRGPWC